MRYLLSALAANAMVIIIVLAIGWSLPIRHTVSRRVGLAARADTDAGPVKDSAKPRAPSFV